MRWLVAGPATTHANLKTTSNGPLPRGGRRLAYQEKRELDSLPAKIETLDAAISVHVKMAQPEFYKRPSKEIARKQRQSKDLEAELAAAYRRWEELEQLVDRV
jgi:ABC transport system ATP-binding/permease protein